MALSLQLLSNDTYILEINNFYTGTVSETGSELLKLIPVPEIDSRTTLSLSSRNM